MSGMHNMMMASGRYSFRFTQVLTSDTLDYNLRTAAIAAGWNQVDPLAAAITVNSGVYLGSSTNTGYGFDTGASFPTGSRLSLVNQGFIVGKGGGIGGGATGKNGGPALRAQHAISVTNNGTIGGGGGQGGSPFIDGGGGGRGHTPGYYGASKSSPGAGRSDLSGGAEFFFHEGDGGDLGENGDVALYGYAGGTAGAAVVGNSNITWIATGTRLGAIT